MSLRSLFAKLVSELRKPAPKPQQAEQQAFATINNGMFAVTLYGGGFYSLAFSCDPYEALKYRAFVAQARERN